MANVLNSFVAPVLLCNLLFFAVVGVSATDDTDSSLVHVSTVVTGASDGPECREVHNENKSERCHFVNSTQDCQLDDGKINYNMFIFCTFSPSVYALGICILILWWLFLFIMLAVTADDFFCPSLVVIAKTLRMSDNIAGVTLLAFGNGAPDVFSAIAAVRTMKKGDAGLAFGALFGAGMFITTIIAGAVSIISPFHAMERPFLRDVIFFLFTVWATFYILYDRKITTYESIGLIVLYVFYVIVVIVGRYIYQKQKRAREKREEEAKERGQGDGPVSSQTEHQTQGAEEDSPDEEDDNNKRTNHTNTSHRGSEDLLNNTNELTPLLVSSTNTQSPEYGNTIGEFFKALNPIDLLLWKESGVFSKIIMMSKALALFILKLFVPVVDLQSLREQWNRHLRCLQCVLAPLSAIYGADASVFVLCLGGVFPVWALVLILGCILAVIVYKTSENEVPPPYHAVFAFAGFLTAVIWIESIASEIVNILGTFGVVFNISNALLGLTLLAWGNSLGDFIADITMARQGFPRTAISACYGGPLFNMLIGLGVPFTIRCIKNGGSDEINFTVIQIVLVSGVLYSLASSLIVVPLMKFHFTRVYGFYCFAIYLAFFIMVIIVETGVIPNVQLNP